jgi:protein LSM12
VSQARPTLRSTSQPSGKCPDSQPFCLLCPLVACRPGRYADEAAPFRVKVTVAPNDTAYEGTIFTACPITNLLVITTDNTSNPSLQATRTSEYHVIPVCHLLSLTITGEGERVEGAVPGFESALPSISKIDTEALKKREEAQIKKMKDQEALRGKGVTKEAQEVFDAMSRT